MRSDDLHRALLPIHRKWHRRKRSVLGKDWTPPSLQDVTRGVWCSKCRVRHGYNGKDKLLSRYEKQGKIWVILWLCPFTYDVVGEYPLEVADGKSEEDGGSHHGEVSS